MTKMICLSNTNSIFDPVGLLTPLTITLKVMLKEMFSKEYELKWDTELPSELKKGRGLRDHQLGGVEERVQQEHHALEAYRRPIIAAFFNGGKFCSHCMTIIIFLEKGLNRPNLSDRSV